MWLATKQGFYSIVKNNESQSGYIVRTRAKKDLENLKILVDELKDRKIVTTIESDYMFRIFIKQEELFELMLFIADDIDYSNFKDKIKYSPNQSDKVGYYSEVWGIMHDYQVKKNKSERINYYKSLYENFQINKGNTKNRGARILH